MFDTIIKILITLLIGGVLIALLPASPFVGLADTISAIPFLGELNWFIPVGRIIATLGVWATCMLAYFCISWILRQLGIIR